MRPVTGTGACTASRRPHRGSRAGCRRAWAAAATDERVERAPQRERSQERAGLLEARRERSAAGTGGRRGARWRRGLVATGNERARRHFGAGAGAARAENPRRASRASSKRAAPAIAIGMATGAPECAGTPGGAGEASRSAETLCPPSALSKAGSPRRPGRRGRRRGSGRVDRRGRAALDPGASGPSRGANRGRAARPSRRPRTRSRGGPRPRSRAPSRAPWRSAASDRAPSARRTISSSARAVRREAARRGRLRPKSTRSRTIASLSPAKRRSPVERLPEHDRRRVDVGCARRPRSPRDLLGRHVRELALELPLARRLEAPRRLGDAEVEHARDAVDARRGCSAG